MDTDLYEDMDPEYRSLIFRARKTLLGNIEDPTLLPENGLSARTLLDDVQLDRVRNIRNRKLASVLNRFSPD